MIKSNPAIYASAQRMVEAGELVVSLSTGVITRATTGRPCGNPNTSGYLKFLIPGPATVLVHRVVWESANGPIPDGRYVNHIDGDKTNNAIDNLELVTHAQNVRHAEILGLRKPTPVASRTWARLTEDDVRRVKDALAAPSCNMAELAREFNVHKSTIHNIKSGRSWSRV